MKIYLGILFLLAGSVAQAQNKIKLNSDSFNDPYTDSLIRQKLVELAMKNPAFAEADALVGTAQYEYKRAKTSWLNTIVVGGNVNEFVVNNTTINGVAASTLYPKYNVGLNVPLGIFGRQEKNISREKIKMYEAERELRKRQITKEVLIRYENYKEAKDLFDLQKQVTDGQQNTYKQKQLDYASNTVKDIGEVNKEYQLWIEERSKQRAKDNDLKVAQLELEEIIGVKLEDAIASIELHK